MREKLMEEPTEWLDPEDEKFYHERMQVRPDRLLPFSLFLDALLPSSLTRRATEP